MRTLKTSEAASLLNVSPNTLRAWERRFGYPKPQRSVGKHRLYTHGEIAALRDALQEGLSISSAVSVAREGLSSETHSLVGALNSLELERADEALEAALALRSLERAVEEVLLPALEDVCQRHGIDSAPWAVAAGWGNEWLRRAQRLSPPPTRPLGIMVGDATEGDFDPEAPAVRTLELFCTRAGAHVISLPVRGVGGLGDLIAAMSVNAVVIAGAGAEDDAVARWAYAVRSSAGALPMTLFKRSPRSAARATGTRVLADAPSLAQRDLFDMIFGREPLLDPHGPAVPRRRPTRINGRRVLA
jgi:DNA-binding transcriptional MerR regulator